MAGPPFILTCALQAEARALRPLLKRHPAARLLVTGVGPHAAYQRLADLLNSHPPAPVLAVGFAGALDPALAVGDLIAPACVIDADTGIHFASAHAFGQLLGPIEQPTLLTVSRPALSPQDKARLRLRFHADAVDMETAAIARLCIERSLSWQALRIITDTADQHLRPELVGLVDAHGRSRPLHAAALLLRRPDLLRPAFQLATAARRAARRLARSLSRHLDRLEDLP